MHMFFLFLANKKKVGKIEVGMLSNKFNGQFEYYHIYARSRYVLLLGLIQQIPNIVNSQGGGDSN